VWELLLPVRCLNHHSPGGSWWQGWRGSPPHSSRYTSGHLPKLYSCYFVPYSWTTEPQLIHFTAERKKQHLFHCTAGLDHRNKAEDLRATRQQKDNVYLVQLDHRTTYVPQYDSGKLTHLNIVIVSPIKNHTDLKFFTVYLRVACPFADADKCSLIFFSKLF
jgi:hypothetical protein